MRIAALIVGLWLAESLAATHQFPHSPVMLRATKTFVDLRDANITKQDLDYSCGASSLSTILTYFYQLPKTEAEILEDMQLKDVMASFQDLAKVSEKYGFSAKGILVDYATLSQIKIPAIVYVNHRGNDHFSVVRAINEQQVFLADSSFGHRKLNKKQFEQMWLVEKTAEGKNLGKVLLILPSDEAQKQKTNRDFQHIEHARSLLMDLPSQFRGF